MSRLRSTSDYGKLLRDPRWQQKRLRIMEAAGWVCEWCGSGSDSLTVHHSYYEKDRSPWDYPDRSLHCLCERCHKRFQDVYDELKRSFGECDLHELDRVHGYIHGLALINGHGFVYARTHDYRLGIAQATGLTLSELDAVIEVDGVLTGEALARAMRNRSIPIEYQI